jgi:hypothetical protein
VVKPLDVRILKALAEFKDGRAGYHALMYKVWPHDKYPRAYRGSVNGGPPGVSWVFGAALNRMYQSSLISRPHEERFGQPDVVMLSAGRKTLEGV